VIKQYKLDASQEASAQEAEANAAAAQATEDIERADRYVLAVVLFASCLFFAGISTRLHTPTGQAAILALGCVMFIGTVVWLVTFPVTVKI
jgi:hypothetical protein